MKKAFRTLAAGIAIWLIVGIFFPEKVFPAAWTVSSQFKNLDAVRAHIEKIEPEWKAFRAQHPGLGKVELFAYTGGDGMFGAYGDVATDADIGLLKRFMEGTHPPRPVYVKAVRVVGEDEPRKAIPGQKVESH